MFQIDAAVNSGNSGGPVYNEYGEVIGIVSAKYSSTGVEGLGFAIPIDDALTIASDLIENGYVTGKAYFGITVSTMTASYAQYYGLVPGALVESVGEGTCAETAGLQPGDIITKLGDYEITSRMICCPPKRTSRAATPSA
jgi:serine protease Do